MSEVHIFAILYPKPDKVDRMKELMISLVTSVHGKEDYTLRYMATEALDAGDQPAIYMFETYKDHDSAEKHKTTEHFQQMFKTGTEEGLMAKPPVIANTKTFAGFDMDRSLKA